MTAPLHPGARLGRYEIVKPLGSGAMGDVYLALDPQIDRHLAIKTVRPHGASQTEIEDRRQRLLREAKAAGRLMHPHAVALFDAGEQEGLVYLAFEFVDGEPLDRRMLREPPLTTLECVRLVRQAASALATAHDQGVIHRDIKPANILLTKSGDAKVADFGIAKVSSQATELTTAGTVIGSPQYMSPEQVRGEPLDGRTDQFSLGTLLYELLSRRRAFQGDTITTLVYLILHEDPVPLAEFRPDLDPRVLDLVIRLMDKDRESRFPTMTETVKEMEAIEDLLERAGGDALPPPLDFAEGATVATRPAGAPPMPPLPPKAPGQPPNAAQPTQSPGIETDATVVSTQQEQAPPLVAPPPQAKKKSFPWVPLLIAGVLLMGVVSIGGFFVVRSLLSSFTDSSEVADADSSQPDPLLDLNTEDTEAATTAATPAQDTLSADSGPDDQQPGAGEADRKETTSGGVEPEVDTTPPSSQATQPSPSQDRREDPPPKQTQPKPAPKESNKQPPAQQQPVQARPETEAPSQVRADPPPVVTEVKEPKPQPTWGNINIDTKIVGGSQVYLAVEPKNVAKEAFLQIKALGDARFTHSGRYWDYRDSGVALPSTGRHLVRLRADGYRDWVAEVDVQPGKASARLNVTMKR